MAVAMETGSSAGFCSNAAASTYYVEVDGVGVVRDLRERARHRCHLPGDVWRYDRFAVGAAGNGVEYFIVTGEIDGIAEEV